MKYLLITTAVIEFGAGLALLCGPSIAVMLLLGSPLEGSPAVTLGRVAGVALLAIGVANWLAHYDQKSFAARGLVIAMVVYNLGAVNVLGIAGIMSDQVGILLWPGILLHTVMAIWCVRSLRRTPVRRAK